MYPYSIMAAADGTETSKAAVRWAAREASRRNLPLRVTHVYDWEWREARYDTSNQYFDLARKHAEDLTAAAVHEARVGAMNVEVEGDPVIGRVTPRLLAECETAQMVVLGSRGRGGFSGLPLGSVSERVATHAPCPVVVVRGRGGDLTEGPVAVGVDSSPSAEHVLSVAFEEASGRNTTLIAVRACGPGSQAEERAALDKQLAPWHDKYPEVPVDVVLTGESAAAALVAASTTAQLVVVGSRGHGIIAGTLLGSVSLQLLHHADCPVYIAREARWQ